MKRQKVHMKDGLSLEDFKHFEIWTEDADADDGSMIPLQEINYYQGQLDAGHLFVLGQLELADKSTCQVILGLVQREKVGKEKIIYFHEIYCVDIEHNNKRELFNLILDDLHGLDFFLDKRFAEVFPVRLSCKVELLNLEIELVCDS